jgi:hypothetical protein
LPLRRSSCAEKTTVKIVAFMLLPPSVVDPGIYYVQDYSKYCHCSHCDYCCHCFSLRLELQCQLHLIYAQFLEYNQGPILANKLDKLPYFRLYIKSQDRYIFNLYRHLQRFEAGFLGEIKILRNPFYYVDYQ